MPLKLISSEPLMETSIFRISTDTALDPDGFEIRRAVIHHPGSAVMMPIDEKGRVLLVRQYRLPARAYLWELSAGRIDAGETPLKAARRELIEETGYRAKQWTKLASFYPSPGFLAEVMTIFVARELKAGAAQPMEDERIECRWFTLKQMEQMIDAGEIRDSKTIIGWSLWKLRGRKAQMKKS